MSAVAPTAADVVLADAADRDFVLGWLEREYDEDGSGFWSNRTIVSTALDEGDLWVIRHEGEAIAFQVGKHAADIVSVRKDLRHAGFGTALFEAALARAVRDDVNVLEGQCSPETSLGFWERMGFARYDDPRRSGEVRVRRILPKVYELPPDLPRVMVRVEFLPESALHSRDEAVAPVVGNDVEGAVLHDGSVMLSRRVLGLQYDEPEGRDLAVRIEIGGVQRILQKAKHAGAAGVVRDWRGEAFFVDVVPPPGAKEEPDAA